MSSIIAGGLLLVAIGGIMYATRAQWLPAVTALVQRANPSATNSVATRAAGDSHQADGHDHSGHDHSGHDHSSHDHGAAGAEGSIEVSDRGLKNVGFKPIKIKPSDFTRTITVPAIVTEIPGKSLIKVAAPMSGIVTKIHILEGQAVEPGALIFEIRLLHEEVVAAQRELLQSAENLDVNLREIKRLEDLSDGAIAGRRIVELKYEQQKTEGALRSQQQALLLHGFSQEQIKSILDRRELLKTLEVRAPLHEHEVIGSCAGDHTFHVQALAVALGQTVEAGEAFCTLADHCQLRLEGSAFEDDAEALRRIAEQRLPLQARPRGASASTPPINGLQIEFVNDRVDAATRAFHFYLALPNEVVLDRQASSGARYVQWKYRPGQRMEIDLPIEVLKDRIVLPTDAVIDEGAENFVYRQNGNLFERVPVHSEFRDTKSVVIANDGAIFPGDVVAASGAYQIHLALKNKSGGGVDPHAGHNH